MVKVVCFYALSYASQQEKNQSGELIFLRRRFALLLEML